MTRRTESLSLKLKKQVREVAAIIPFGSRFSGIRYRLRTSLTSEQKELMCDFLVQQIARHRYSLFSAKVKSIEGKNMNCATFCWFAFKYAAGIDIDSNKGIIVFPNDCIRSLYFDNQEGRIRF